MKFKQFWSDLGGKLGVGLIGAGFLLVFLGWNGAASVDRVPAQFPYLISGGVAGLSLVVCGVGVLVVQTQRAENAELRAALQELRRAITGDAEEVATSFEPPAPRPTPARYQPGAPAVEIVHADHADPGDAHHASTDAGQDQDHGGDDDTRVIEAVTSTGERGGRRSRRGGRKPLRADG